MIPNWSNIASSVTTIQPILRPTVLLQDHTADSQMSRATTGMTKSSNQTNVSGRLICNLLARSNSRKQTVGLRNADNQTTVLNQTGTLRRGCGIEAFTCLTTEIRDGPNRMNATDNPLIQGQISSSLHRMVGRSCLHGHRHAGLTNSMSFLAAAAVIRLTSSSVIGSIQAIAVTASQPWSFRGWNVIFVPVKTPEMFKFHRFHVAVVKGYVDCTRKRLVRRMVFRNLSGA